MASLRLFALENYILCTLAADSFLSPSSLIRYFRVRMLYHHCNPPPPHPPSLPLRAKYRYGTVVTDKLPPQLTYLPPTTLYTNEARLHCAKRYKLHLHLFIRMQRHLRRRQCVYKCVQCRELRASPPNAQLLFFSSSPPHPSPQQTPRLVPPPKKFINTTEYDHDAPPTHRQRYSTCSQCSP